jgi:hypothetical protein
MKNMIILDGILAESVTVVNNQYAFCIITEDTAPIMIKMDPESEIYNQLNKGALVEIIGRLQTKKCVVLDKTSQCTYILATKVEVKCQSLLTLSTINAIV